MPTNEEQLREALSETTQELERIATSAALTATVIAIDGASVQLGMNGGTIDAQRPSKIKDLEVGMSVLIEPSSKQILRKNGFSCARHIVVVNELIGEQAVIEVGGVKKLVPFRDKSLRAGDRATLDEHASFVYDKVIDAKPRHSAPPSDVTWDDVGGNTEAKEALIEAVELPHTHPEIFAKYGAKPAKGILLYGPPGCGKTMLGKALATSLGSSDGFILCKGPEVLNEYVGVAEATIRALFERARQFHGDTGRRAVIFIDEAEAILGARGARHAHMEKTIVPQFLTEMDGFEDSCATVILATNKAMALDAAVVRPGRIDRKIRVARPNPLDCYHIVLSHLRHSPVDGNLEELRAVIVASAFKSKFRHAGEEKELKTAMSGSLLAGVVEQAKKTAMRRDIQNGSFSGIGITDLEEGLRVVTAEIGATQIEVAD